MSWLTKIALKKRWLTFLIVAILTGFSIWSTFELQMELIPDIELPVTSVITVYPQAKAETVMDEVTLKVESAISGLKGLDQIVSTASDGTTSTFAIFEYGTDMTKTNRQIEENLAALDLPEEVLSLPEITAQLTSNPTVYAIDMNLMPVVMLSLTGDMTTEELKTIAENDIIPALQQIENVYYVSTEGGSSPQVIVDLDPAELNENGLSLSAVAYALSQQQYDSITALENTPVSMTGTLLADVGMVSMGFPSGSAISRTNGENSYSINVLKSVEGNTVFVSNAVIDEVERIRATLPEGVHLYTVLDQSDYIETSIGDLTRDALIGCALAVVVVFFFLMAFRASLVTAVSIPLSVFLGFFIMRFFGITINLLTLSAMAIAVGRVIDNSIVVLEVIYRRRQSGEPFRSAALEGVREVAMPITSSTLATIVIFVPLALVGGIVGELFIPFALTMAAALVASLLVALMVVPPMADFPVKKKDAKEQRQTWYERSYLRSLKWVLSHRGLALLIAVVLFVGSFALTPVIGTSFMPNMGEKMLTIEVVMPDGTSLADTESAAIEVENIISTHPDVISFQTTAGTSSSITGSFMSLLGASETSASMEVFLVSSSDMDQVAAELREDLANIAAAEDITVTTGEAISSSVLGSGLDIYVRGDSYDDIATASQELFAQLEGMDGVTDLELDLAPIEPSLSIVADEAKIAAAGISAEQLSQIEQEGYLLQLGTTVSQATIDGTGYDVYLNSIVERLDSIELAQNLHMGFPQSVKLGDIATVELGAQQTSIQRIDEKLAATITGSITDKDVGAVNSAVQDKIDTMTLPEGVEITMGGTIEMMDEAFSDMYIAILIAIVLAFAVIAVTFRSIVTPFVIMLSLPLASIGALLGLLITGHTIGISAMMGVLMLVGIVLTNAIVLIDMVERLRKNGASVYDALVESGRTRMRPILMTALTTMIAMLPLAAGLGEGTIISAELAIVVIGGLFSSTLLTLLVVPVMYSLFKEKRKAKTSP